MNQTAAHSRSEEATLPEESTPRSTANPAQLRSVMEHNLTFTLGSAEFGIQVLHIKELPQAPVPAAAPDIRDLTLRNDGPLIPVADLSLNFDFNPRAYTDRACIVVVRTQPSAPSPTSDTLNIASEDIELAPDFGDGAPMPYLLGMARVHGTVKLLQHPIHALLKLTGDA